MRAIFLCKTPYQILVAVRLKNSMSPKMNGDIIIFDTIANYKVLGSRLEGSGFFDHVYYFCGKKIGTYHGIRGKVASVFYSPKILLKEQYNRVYMANVYDWVENAIVKTIQRISCEKIDIYMYEDGFATYSNHYADFFSMINSKNIIARSYYKVAFSEYYKIKGLCVFSPELVSWKPNFDIVEIKKIEDKDVEYKQIINDIFGYSSMQDLYSQKYVFFEESYYADGIEIDDVDLVKKIAEVVGKDNLIIKIHPRNPVNRFKKSGYITNINTEIPWEVIALNINIAEKVLITIASGSALTSLINMKSCPRKVVMLMNCKEIDERKLTPTLHLLRRIAEQNNQVVCLPKYIGEALNEIVGGQYENSSNHAN